MTDEIFDYQTLWQVLEWIELYDFEHMGGRSTVGRHAACSDSSVSQMIHVISHLLRHSYFLTVKSKVFLLNFRVFEKWDLFTQKLSVLRCSLCKSVKPWATKWWFLNGMIDRSNFLYWTLWQVMVSIWLFGNTFLINSWCFIFKSATHVSNQGSNVTRDL